MEKMTNVKALEYVVANYDVPTDVAEKLDNMIVSLKKKSANRKPTKTQKENEDLKNIVLSLLTTDGQTVTEIMGKDEVLSGLSNQKVSALLRSLIADGKAVRIEDKKKSLFALAD